MGQYRTRLFAPSPPTCSPSALRLHDRYVRISTTDTLSSSCVTLSMKLLFRDPTSCATRNKQTATGRQAQASNFKSVSHSLFC